MKNMAIGGWKASFDGKPTDAMESASQETRCPKKKSLLQYCREQHYHERVDVTDKP